MNNDLVSVVVPIYNVEKFMCECVQSISHQTYSNIEIILVDDGSTDGCPGICDNLAEEDSRITVIHQKNKGLPGARNSGLKIAKGQWILFVDSDDWIAENAIEILVDEAGRSEAVDMVLFKLEKCREYSPFRKGTEDMGRAVLTLKDIDALFHDAFDPMREEFNDLHEGKVPAVTKLYNMDFLKRNGLCFFEEVKVHEDIPFAAAVYHKAGRIVFVDAELYRYRYNPNSITNSFRANYVKEMKDLINRMDKIAQEIENADYAKELLNDRIIVCTVNLLIRCFCHKNNSKSYKQRKQDYDTWAKDMALQDILRNVNSSTFQMKKRAATLLLKTDSFWLMNFVIKFCGVMEAK